MEITLEELTKQFRKLQNGHRYDGGYYRGVTDCIRVINNLAEGRDVLDGVRMCWEERK